MHLSLLLLSLFPLSTSLFFGGGCDPCSSSLQLSLPQISLPTISWPSPQQSYYPQQAYYPAPQPQYYAAASESYVVPPPSRSSSYRNSPVHRTPSRPYSIPQNAYGNSQPMPPPRYRPTLGRSGYGHEFVSEGSIPLRQSEEGERVTYVVNRKGPNYLRVHSVDVASRPSAHPIITQPTVDEVAVEAKAAAREEVQSVMQPVRAVERLYRPSTHTEPTYAPAATAYEEPAPHVIESNTEFQGETPSEPQPPVTLAYPIEQQAYDSAPSEAPISPYEATTEYAPLPPAETATEVAPSMGYDGEPTSVNSDDRSQFRSNGITRSI